MSKLKVPAVPHLVGGGGGAPHEVLGEVIVEEILLVDVGRGEAQAGQGGHQRSHGHTRVVVSVL